MFTLLGSLGHWQQSYSQDLETRCPKLAKCKMFWVSYFQGRPQMTIWYSLIITKNIYYLLKYGMISLHNVIGLMGIILRCKKWIIWHFKRFLRNFGGCPEGWLLGVWVSKWCLDALLVKTMINSMTPLCWLVNSEGKVIFSGIRNLV